MHTLVLIQASDACNNVSRNYPRPDSQNQRPNNGERPADGGIACGTILETIGNEREPHEQRNRSGQGRYRYMSLLDVESAGLLAEERGSSGHMKSFLREQSDGGERYHS